MDSACFRAFGRRFHDSTLNQTILRSICLLAVLGFLILPKLGIAQSSAPDVTTVQFPAGDRRLALPDASAVVSYLLFSPAPVAQRLPNLDVDGSFSDHFMVVRPVGTQWYVGDNNGWIPFTPASGDRLIAVIDLSEDTSAFSLRREVLFGIPTGIIDTDLAILPNYFGAKYNKGEVTVSGSYFTFESSRRSVGADEMVSLRGSDHSIAVHDDATGSGFLMFSPVDVHQRFQDVPSAASSSVLAVRFHQGQWEYSNDSTWNEFAVTDDDVLIAIVDFSTETVLPLEGFEYVASGVKAGYRQGDLVVIPNSWRGRYNKNEFQVLGTNFTRSPSVMSGSIEDAAFGSCTFVVGDLPGVTTFPDGSHVVALQPETRMVAAEIEAYVRTDGSGDGAPYVFDDLSNAIDALNELEISGATVFVAAGIYSWGEAAPEFDMNLIADGSGPVIVRGEAGRTAAFTNGDYSYYIDGIAFVGGDRAFDARNGRDLTVVRSEFSHTSGDDGVFVANFDTAVIVNSIAHNNAGDGFSYHDRFGDSMVVLEIEVTAIGNGSAMTPASQGSSAHDRVEILRVGGTYSGNSVNIADITSARSINIGIAATNPIGLARENFVISGAGHAQLIGGVFSPYHLIAAKQNALLEVDRAFPWDTTSLYFHGSSGYLRDNDGGIACPAE